MELDSYPGVIEQVLISLVETESNLRFTGIQVALFGFMRNIPMARASC